MSAKACIDCALNLALILVFSSSLMASPLKNDITALRFNSDGTKLVIGYSNGSVSLWDVEKHVEVWTADGNWKQTQPLAIKLGKSRLQDEIVIASKEINPAQLSSFREELPVQRIFFRNNEKQILVTERWGGLRVIQASDGGLIRAQGVFFSITDGKQLETLGDTDYDELSDKLVITGALIDEVYLLDVEKAIWGSEYQLVVLDDKLRALKVAPPTSLVVTTPTGLDKSAAASDMYLYSSSGRDKFDSIRFCGQYILAASSSGRLVVWDSPSSYYVRNIKKTNINQKESTALICGESGQFFTAFGSTPYGRLQAWDTSDVGIVKQGGEADRNVYSYIDYDPVSHFVVTGNSHQFIVWDVSSEVMREVGMIYRKDSGKGELITAAAIDRAHGRLAIYDNGDVIYYNLAKLTVDGYLGLSESNFEALKGIKMPPRKIVDGIIQSSKIGEYCDREGFRYLERDMLFMRTAYTPFEEYLQAVPANGARPYSAIFPHDNLKNFWLSAREYFKSVE